MTADQTAWLGSVAGSIVGQWLTLALIAWSAFSVVVIVRFLVLVGKELRSDTRYEISVSAPHDRL